MIASVRLVWRQAMWSCKCVTSIFQLSLSLSGEGVRVRAAGGEAEKGKSPVDLFPAERVRMILARPGGNKG